MPKIGPELREKRRRHVLESAWACFSRDGFHATSMDQIVAESGMSTSAVYAYAHSKDELIDAAAEEAFLLVEQMLDELTEGGGRPGPVRTVTKLVEAVLERAARDDYDLTRIAMQAWFESLRRPELHERTTRLYAECRARLEPIVDGWRAAGWVPPDVPVDTVAYATVMLIPGLIVLRHVDGHLDVGQVIAGFGGLGIAVRCDPERAPDVRPSDGDA